jgi:diguanylate cyclase (GGDEF)-like protein/PAS domain S-box-containing protein
MSLHFHPTLACQLNKLGLDAKRLPDSESWLKLLSFVEQTYQEANQDRDAFERTLSITAEVMHPSYRQQKSTYDIRLQALVNATNDLIWMKDAEGVYLLCNTMFERFFNAPQSAILGKTDYNFVSRELADHFRKQDFLAMSIGKSNGNEEWLDFGDCSHSGLFETVKTPVYDESGKLLGVMGIARDITRRKQLEMNLHQEICKSEELLKAASDGLHIIDLNGNLVQVSDSFCRMLGYRRDEMIGMNILQWDARLENVMEFKFELAQLPKNGDEFETQFRCKDGHIIEVEISAVHVSVADDHLVYASARNISERKRSEQQLRDKESNLRAILENIPYLVWLKNVEGEYLTVNPLFIETSGKSGADEIIGKTDFDLWPEELANKYFSDDAKVMNGGQQIHFEETLLSGSKECWVETFKSPIIDSEGRIVGTTGIARDISDRRRVEESLKIAAMVYRASSEAMLVTDGNNKIINVNPAFTNITGYTFEEIIGKNPRILQSNMHDHAFYQAMWSNLLEHDYWQGEVWDRRKNGEIYPKLLTINAIRDTAGNVERYVALFSDVTEKKKSEETIWRQANFDMLTGLPNRRLLMDRLASALSQSSRNKCYGALLFLDLDKFKVLNDTMGHDFGDLLLIEVAGRTQSCVRSVDTVARFGGDEFVILVESIDESAEITSHKVSQLAEKIRESLSVPYQLKNIEYHSSPSIGVSLFQGDEHSVDVVLKRSDLAMYQAKDSGRNTVRFFDPEIQNAVESRAILEADLRRAVSGNQLRLFYQIQVDNQYQPLGAEALVRWIHPTRGMVSPAQFIPVAEDSALILEIGYWVLLTACQQLANWAQNESTQNLKLAINVSAKQFRQHDFVSKVSDALTLFGVEPSSLKLELTESVVLNDLVDVVTKMNALKKLGVKLSLDDFGTGYSSLSYLKNLPLDQIKIDQSFVRDITTDSDDAIMVKTIIDLAQNFRLNVIAEGVETQSQLDFLKRNNCMAYQGYFFSKPVPIEEFEALLKQNLAVA